VTLPPPRKVQAAALLPYDGSLRIDAVYKEINHGFCYSQHYPGAKPVEVSRGDPEMAWHLLTKQEDYAFARPALVAMKERQMQMKAGAKSRRGGNKPGQARDYSTKELRDKERALATQAENAYARFVSV
jgi:hypothetical protein